jgi:hypothetical protein
VPDRKYLLDVAVGFDISGISGFTPPLAAETASLIVKRNSGLALA